MTVKYRTSATTIHPPIPPSETSAPIRQSRSEGGVTTNHLRLGGGEHLLDVTYPSDRCELRR